MASGDTENQPKYMTFSKSNLPIIGAAVDFVETSFQYFVRRDLSAAETLHPKISKASLSATYLAGVCMLVGLVCNVKFEVVTLSEEPLPTDLHFMLMSTDDKLYVDDVDVSRVLWCVEASDLVVLLMSTFMIWISSIVRSPFSEYIFLPWLGVSLRGLFLRQAPTAGALMYTMGAVNGAVDPLFLTAFSFLFILEARLWLEIARLVRSRWETYHHIATQNAKLEVETLWSNEDVQSVEVQNFVY